MSERPVFKPFPLWTGCHSQTIAACFLVFGNSSLSSLKRFVYLKDGEKLVMEITTPKGWKETDRTALLLHGLCGSHQSSYVVRMAKKLHKTLSSRVSKAETRIRDMIKHPPEP